MSDEPSREDLQFELEKLKARFEQDRLGIERFRNELQRWNQSMGPMHEASAISVRGEIELGMNALRSIAWINGGALFVLPAYGSIVGVESLGGFEPAIWAAACFATGLLLALITNLVGYLAQGMESRRIAESIATTARELNLDVIHQDKSGDERDKIKKTDQTLISLNRAVDSWRAKFKRTVWVAIILGLLSAGFFGAGATVFIWAAQNTTAAENGADSEANDTHS